MISENVVGFKCIRCEKEWSLKQVKYQCPDCGGNVEVVYDYKKVARYRDEIKKAPLKDIYKYIKLLPPDTELNSILKMIQKILLPLLRTEQGLLLCQLLFNSGLRLFPVPQQEMQVHPLHVCVQIQE